MKKLVFSLITIAVFSITAAYACSFFPSISIASGINKNGGKINEISIGSNRISGEMQLHFTASAKGKAYISILNEDGKTVLQQTQCITASSNIITLKNANYLPEGAYTVALFSNSKTYTARFMIWK